MKGRDTLRRHRVWALPLIKEVESLREKTPIDGTPPYALLLNLCLAGALFTERERHAPAEESAREELTSAKRNERRGRAAPQNGRGRGADTDLTHFTEQDTEPTAPIPPNTVLTQHRGPAGWLLFS
ncbi:unnamed protein product [Pleuronectes platessa]|uniref:Uncharacterized protein n=1 Tax=Pleuronectes platessa TaxID=8262 RepID=A0A9N7YP05_PLEPL|nr:unnamed protein product [Pleuronectes platessa]